MHVVDFDRRTMVAGAGALALAAAIAASGPALSDLDFGSGMSSGAGAERAVVPAVPTPLVSPAERPSWATDPLASPLARLAHAPQ